MKTLRVVGTITACVLVGGLLLVGLSTSAEAIKEVDSRPFGMVGIVIGAQTARLNVVLPLGKGDTPADTCMPTLMFFDGAGNPLDAVGGPSPHMRPGQAAFLDFTGVDNPDFRPGERVQIRVLVDISDPRQRQACQDLIPTLEIFDTETGKTSIIMFDVFKR